MARVIRADQHGPKVVPATIVDASARARALVERARTDADALRARAYHEGQAQGRAEFAAKLLELAQARDRMLLELEPQVIELAMLAARRVIGQALAMRPELIGELVSPLLARLRRAQTIVLRVHPDDRVALESCLDRLRSSQELASGLQIETDTTLSRGGCVLVSDVGSLDARIETQLEALARVLGVA